MTTVKDMTAYASAHLAVTGIAAIAVLAAVFMAWRAARGVVAAARRALAGRQAEDVLTVVAAAMATAVAANGMWRFFGAVLHFSGAERVTMFAFLEIAVVTCAFRARRNMTEFSSAGVEGIAVWVLSGLSAVFSALDARSGPEAAFRLAPPLVAAWLWHRAMSLEHRRTSGRAVHWRLTAERVLVWLGLAEPAARAASDVDAHRRIARLARAAKKLRELRATGAASWRQQRARRQLDAALEAAVEHAGLASDPARQDQMRDQIGALTAAETLASLDAEAPWDRSARAARDSEIQRQAQDLVRAAEADRDQAVAAAGQAAAEQVQAAARITEAVTAQVRALEQSREDLRARAEAAELALGEALARAEVRAGSGADGRAGNPAPEADRDALVAELAAEIRAAAADGEKWRPPYDALIERTGRQRRWCEYLVAAARSAVFGAASPDTEGHTECDPVPASWPADAGPGAGSDADHGVAVPDDAGELTDELALAGAR